MVQVATNLATILIRSVFVVVFVVVRSTMTVSHVMTALQVKQAFAYTRTQREKGRGEREREREREKEKERGERDKRTD
jgi:hypothetical protein